MHIFRWNVNGLRSRLRELDILRMRYSLAAICLQETHLRPTHTASLRGCASYRYDHLPGERANGGTAIFIRDSVYSCQVQLQRNIQAVAVQIYTTGLTFTICNVYLQPHTPVTLSDLQDLVSQLPTPYLLLGDFNARHHLCGAVDEDERGRVLETLISRCNLVVLNTGEPTHISLASGTLSCLDLAICSPALSLHLTWTLLADLCGSDHFPICLSLQSASLQEERNPNWVMKQADWVLFSQLAEVEETYCPTVDSMVDMFTHAVLRASEHSIPRSSSKPRRVPVPWWTEECRDAIRALKRALGVFRRQPTEENLINFKQFRARARQTVRKCKRNSWCKFVSSITSRTPSTVVSGHLRRISGKCIHTFSRPFLWTASQ
jgi:exonuclease III